MAFVIRKRIDLRGFLLETCG